jgi:hypothetical protein
MGSILGVAVRPVRPVRTALVTSRLAVLYAVVRREDSSATSNTSAEWFSRVSDDCHFP